MLDANIKALAKGANYAVITSVMPNGDVQAQPIWVDCDDEFLLVNTERDRQRERNYRRDKRCTITIISADSWMHWAEVRGEVVDVIAGPDARAHIDALSMKYVGHLYANPIGTERLIVKVRPNRQKFLDWT